MKPLKLPALFSLLCMFLSACAPAALPAGPSARERVKTIKNYTVYYAKGRVDDLARYQLAILQFDTLTADELAQLKAHGTLSIAYLSLGEVEPRRPWYSDGRVDPAWVLGKNENW